VTTPGSGRPGADPDLRIERVETVILDVPLRRPHRFARVGMDAQPVLLVSSCTPPAG